MYICHRIVLCISSFYFYKNTNTLKKISFLLFLFYSFTAFCQENYTKSFYQSTAINAKDSASLFFSIENSNFFRNDELFNLIVEGYTLTGYFINPTLSYIPHSKIKIDAGIHLLKYSGVDNYTKNFPIFRVQYQATDKLKIVLGSLYGTTNHNLIEPIFHYEKYYTENNENGVQFLLKNKRLQSDIWINWQNFIFHGDTEQEELTGGMSNYLRLNKKDSRHKLGLPFQLVAVHRGGQINETPAYMVTRLNIAAGISYEFQIRRKWIQSIGTSHYYLSFTDMSPTKTLPYIMGYGYYSQYFVRNKNLQLELSYWYGDYYTSERGAPIYRTVSTKYSNLGVGQRALGITKLSYEKNIFNQIYFGARLETYWDFFDYQLDYCYGIYLKYNGRFLLKKF